MSILSAQSAFNMNARAVFDQVGGVKLSAFAPFLAEQERAVRKTAKRK